MCSQVFDQRRCLKLVERLKNQGGKILPPTTTPDRAAIEQLRATGGNHQEWRTCARVHDVFDKV